VFPDPIPGAGDITPRSEWTSLSTASIRSGTNGEVTSEGEATIFAVANGFEASEASMRVGGSEASATGVLKGLGELGFGAKGVDGSIELAKLILALSETRDVGCESPVPQVACCVLKMGVASCTPLKEAEEPRAHGLHRE